MAAVAAVQWPGQTALDAEAVARERPWFLYSLSEASMMQFHSDAMLERLVRLARLGDWAATELAVMADVLPSATLPPLASAAEHAAQMAPGLPQLAFAAYAWRRGETDLAEQVWARCGLPEGAVALASLQAEPAARIEQLEAAPDCRSKLVQLAVARLDGAALEALGEQREAGLAHLRAGNREQAKRLLLAAVREHGDEAACRLLLAGDLDAHQDEQLLETLARHCVEGKQALGNFRLRHGRRDEALALFHEAGLFAGGPRLVAVGAMEQDELDAAIAARVAQLQSLFFF